MMTHVKAGNGLFTLIRLTSYKDSNNISKMHLPIHPLKYMTY